MLWIHQRPFDGERLAAGAAARRDRHAVARARRAALRRRRRARLRRLLQPGRARGRRRRRCAKRSGERRGLDDAALSRRPAGAGRARSSRASTGSRRARRCERDRAHARSLDGDWEFRLVGAARGGAPRALGQARGWTRSRCPASGRCRASTRRTYTNVVMPFPSRRRRARGEPDGHLPARVRGPARLARAARGAALRRRRGRAHVARERRSRSGSRRTRARRPSSTSPTLVRRGGANELVAVVVRWSDASFVEDQDQWWHAGISRAITLVSPSVVADVERARGHGRRRARGRRDGERRLEARLLDPRGRDGPRRAVRAAGSRRGVRAPRLWSAEEPCALHARGRAAAARRVSCHVGFRTVEVRDRQLLVNGERAADRAASTATSTTTAAAGPSRAS